MHEADAHAAVLQHAPTLAPLHQLVLPILQHRERQHDQRALGATRREGTQHEDERLDRLAQAHLVLQRREAISFLFFIPKQCQQGTYAEDAPGLLDEEGPHELHSSL